MPRERECVFDKYNLNHASVRGYIFTFADYIGIGDTHSVLQKGLVNLRWFYINYISKIFCM